MSDLLLIAGVFLLAGFVKGVIGLGLPTISMGLLVLFMPPAAAAALIVPSLITNLWQMFGGANLAALVRRLWPMLAGVCLGTWAGAGLLAMAGVGMWLGQALRLRLRPATFSICFFVGLFALGLYLAVSAML
jgi:uncharacterized protein